MSEEILKEPGSRVSVRFLVDNAPYNAGESAVFAYPVAAGLVQRGLAKFNAHDVENDSGLMNLIEGKNNDSAKANAGCASDAELSDLIDKKLDEKLKPILDALNKSDANKPADKPFEPKAPLAPAVKK